MTPFKSENNSSSLLPVSSRIYSISTVAFSPIDTASASSAVSTSVIGLCGLIVRLKNISALRSSSPFSLITSSAESRAKELSSPNADTLALLLISPYFFV